MKRLIPLLLLLGTPAFAAEAPVDVASPTPAWAPVFATLAKPRNIRSKFTELRHSRFRSKPVEVAGVMRYAPGLGVSIEHLGEDTTVTLINEKGLYRRDDGRFELVDHDVPAVRAPRMLYPVFSFDGKSVAKNFSATGEIGEKSAWTLTLTPRDESLTAAVARLELAGDARGITRIVIVRDASTRIEIRIGETEFPEHFPAPETQAYFTGWRK